MSKLLSVFNSISLTLTQWVILTMAAVISGLVFALRLQGSKLHKAQVELLEQHIRTVDAKDDEAVNVARKRFLKAYNKFKSN